MKIKILIKLLTGIVVCSMFAGCGQAATENPEVQDTTMTQEIVNNSDTENQPVAMPDVITTGQIGVIYNDEFKNTYIDLTIDEFNELGFAFGDSIDIAFDNGKTYTDVPYYSGYYVPVGELLACGYPGYPHVVIARNYGNSTWEEFELNDDSKVCITMNQKGKYLANQELFDLKYSDDRNDFDSDIVFANFREIKGGNIREGMFYRSASPCDNTHNRAVYANDLAEEYNIKVVLNLADNEEKYGKYIEANDFASDYYNDLYENGGVLLLAMDANYRSDEFAGKVANGLYETSKMDGAVLVHCLEGKDRTGFVCALMLALSDASAQEIIDDYMITYDNYYGVTEETSPEKYEAILGNVYDFFYCMCDADKGTDVYSLDLKAGAESYLKKGGLTDEEIADIETYLTGK